MLNRIHESKMEQSIAPSKESLLASLNKYQTDVVLYTGQRLLVLAAAGTGKTQSLTSRIAAFILDGISPESILALTFTNKAAREMRERAAKLSGTSSDKMLIGTYHSMCAKILRTHATRLGIEGITQGFHIMDNTESLKLVKDCLYRMGYRENGLIRVPDLLSLLNGWRNAGVESDQVNTAPPPGNIPNSRLALDVARTLYKVYRQACVARNAVDFSDLIMYVLRLFKSCPDITEEYKNQWTHIFVDEFQDTNESQLQLLKLLTNNKTNLMVVGDDCQAIHGWRGAVLNNILHFEQHFPGTTIMLLEDNYRSYAPILHAANRLISYNTRQHKKALRPTRDSKDTTKPLITVVEYKSPDNEAEEIANLIKCAIAEGAIPGDFAILYRINAQSQPLEETLASQGIPYSVRGSMSFYQRAEVKDVIAYLHLLYLPDDCDASFKRVSNVPPRGIGPKLLKDIMDKAAKNQGGCMDAARLYITAAEDQADKKKKGGSTRKYAGMRQLLEVLDDIRSSGMSLQDASMQLLQRAGYLKWLAGQSDGDDRLQNVYQLIGMFKGMNYTDVLNRVFDEEDDPTDDKQGKVSMMTLHASKGLEFKHVFIVGFDSVMLPFHKAVQEGRIDEERRLAYVGVTRARDSLFLTYPTCRQTYAGPVVAEPSIFVTELGL